MCNFLEISPNWSWKFLRIFHLQNNLFVSSEMPVPKRSRSKSAKRTKALKKFRPVFTNPKTILPSQFQKVTFRYFDSPVLNAAAGATAVHIYRTNGLFDPDLTGVGHQPRGFDQLMPLYDNYVVIGAKITVRFSWNTSPIATAKEACCVGVCLGRDFAPRVVPGEYEEDGYSNFKVITPLQTQELVVTHTFNNAFLGIKDPMDEAQIKGDITQNPALLGNFHVFVSPMSTGNNDIIDASVLIEYITILDTPLNPAQS